MILNPILLCFTCVGPSHKGISGPRDTNRSHIFLAPQFFFFCSLLTPQIKSKVALSISSPPRGNPALGSKRAARWPDLTPCSMWRTWQRNSSSVMRWLLWWDTVSGWVSPPSQVTPSLTSRSVPSCSRLYEIFLLMGLGFLRDRWVTDVCQAQIKDGSGISFMIWIRCHTLAFLLQF